MNKHIKTAKDLETTYGAKRSGFLEIALRKNKEALPYIDEAKALKTIAELYASPIEMAKDARTKRPLAEAAGVSTKAGNYLEQKDIDDIVSKFIENFLLPAGDKFIDEVVYRFLLAKGDALGGRMRNIVGAIASEKFTRYLTANLRNSNIEHFIYLGNAKKWLKSNDVSQDELGYAKALRYKNLNGLDREINYNITVPVVKKNIDISIFNGNTALLKNANDKKNYISDPMNYLALGELKGGIDPAGADEHWKTANTALQRIRTSFSSSGNPVKTFFVGGAIEVSMAEEIFNQTERGELAIAANLTNESQLSELCAWIIAL